MTDVSPGLYAAIKEAFEKKAAANSALQKYIKALNAGEIAEFKGAYDYTELLGTCLAGSFQEVLSSDVLPDGKMYFNIAKSVVEPFLAENYEAAVDAAAKVEEVLNKRANIGMKPIRPGVDQDKIDGIINRLSSEEHFDDVKWILDEPVVNLTQSGVDDTIRENVEFHARSGFTPTVTRISTRKCCEWCSRLAGRYKYPDVPKDVYRRHENCRCTVEYDPGDGKKQNVWSKRLYEDAVIQNDVIENYLYEEKKYMSELPLKQKTRETFLKLREKAKTPAKVTYEDGFKPTKFPEEDHYAKVITDQFGGNIKLLLKDEKKRRCDYLWNGEPWELKDVSSKNSVDKQIQSALGQINARPGGIVLSRTNPDLEINEIYNTALNRLNRSASHYGVHSAYILVYDKDNLVLAFEWQ